MTLIYIASPKGCIEGKDYDHWEYRDEKLEAMELWADYIGAWWCPWA